jgi:Rrf2 family protein
MLSTSSIHAIRATIVLADLPEGSYAGTAKLGERIGAPPNYLGKLLQQLARNGLLRSQKGLGGGFCLGKAADSITLLDVVEPLEHIKRWELCILGRTECSDAHPCSLHDRWNETRTMYLNLLGTTTIASLVVTGGAGL